MSLNLTGYDIVAWLERQIDFSTRVFGPGDRREGIARHIEKELVEARDSNAVEEWIDIAILALDQAWRAGGSAAAVIEALHRKQQVNIRRSWPDWKSVPFGYPVEHIKEISSLDGGSNLMQLPES